MRTRQQNLFGDDRILRYAPGDMVRRSTFAMSRRRSPTDRELDLHAAGLARRGLEDSGGRIIPVLAATDQRARDGHTIHGWNFAHFETHNPVVLYNHDRERRPVAQASWIDFKPKTGELRSLSQFTPAEINRFGWEIGEMTYHGFINQPSVGFWILEAERERDAKVLKHFPHALRINEAGLFEYSVVNIESDTATGFGRNVQKAASEGLEVQAIARWAEQTIDEKPELEYRAALEDVARLRMRTRTKRWILSNTACEFCQGFARTNEGNPISTRARFRNGKYSVAEPPAHDECVCGVEYFDLDGAPDIENSFAARDHTQDKEQDMKPEEIATLFRNVLRSEAERCCGQDAMPAAKTEEKKEAKRDGHDLEILAAIDAKLDALTEMLAEAMNQAPAEVAEETSEEPEDGARSIAADLADIIKRGK